VNSGDQNLKFPIVELWTLEIYIICLFYLFLHNIYTRPVILYGSETWALRKSDENKFLILERKILRKIFGSIKDDITGEWRREKIENYKKCLMKIT